MGNTLLFLSQFAKLQTELAFLQQLHQTASIRQGSPSPRSTVAGMPAISDSESSESRSMPRRSSRSIRRAQLPSRQMSAKRSELRSGSQRKASQSESRSMRNRSSRSERSIRRRESRRHSVEGEKKRRKGK